MENKKHKLTTEFLNNFIADSHFIICHTSFHFAIAAAIVLLHFLQMIMVTVDIPSLNLRTDVANAFNYFNVILPYKLIKSFDLSILILVLVGNILPQIIVIYGFFVCRKLKNHPKLMQFYSIFLYFYDFNICFPLFGCLLKFTQVQNNLNPVLVICTQICFIVSGIISIILVCTINIFFANFFVQSKDPFARTASPIFLINKLLAGTVLALDVLISHSSDAWIGAMLNLGLGILLVVDFFNRIPYSNYKVSVCYIYSIFAYFWVTLMFISAVNLKITLIHTNLLVLIFVGVFFIMLVIYCYRDFLQRRLLNADYESISNDHLFSKKIMFTLRLIKNSKKNKADELRLASLFRFHIDVCKNVKCLCKNPELVYNGFKSVSANSELPVFKDPVLLKSILFSILYELKPRIIASESLSLNFILFTLEITQNLAMCGNECALFEKNFGKSMSFLARVCLIRVKLSLKNKLKIFNRKSDEGYNKYECLVQYDAKMNQLKLIKKRDNFGNDQSIFLFLENFGRSKFQTTKSEKRKIVKHNKQLFNLDFYYKKYVLFEPLDLKKYRRSLNNLTNQFEQEMAKPTNLYLLDPNSFVINSSCRIDNLGQILWASKNAINILEIEEKYLLSLSINSLMPREVTPFHDSLIGEFLQYSKSNFINKINDLWMIGAAGKLISVKMAVKLFFQTSGISFFSYSKILSENQSVIMNKLGEVSSFGNYFAKISGLRHEMGNVCANLSIFFFMPQMLVLFLSEFYGLPDFKLNDAAKINLEFTYFFVFKNMSSILVDFTKKVNETQASQSIVKYAQLLYSHLSVLSFKDIDVIYRVRINTNKTEIKRSTFNFKFWTIKILDLLDVTKMFTEKNFKMFFWFSNKINFTNKLQASIDNYANRMLKDNRIYANQSSSKVEVYKVINPNSFKNIKGSLLGLSLENSVRKRDSSQKANLINNFGIIGEDYEADYSKKDNFARKKKFQMTLSFVEIEDRFAGEKGERVRQLILKAFAGKIDYRVCMTATQSLGNKWMLLVIQFLAKTKVAFNQKRGLQIENMPHNFSFDDLVLPEQVHTHRRNFEVSERPDPMDYAELGFNVDNGSMRSASVQQEIDIVDIYKNKMKNNIKLKKQNLRLISFFFLLSFFGFLVFSLISGYLVRASGRFVFTTAYAKGIISFPTVISKILALSFISQSQYLKSSMGNDTIESPILGGVNDPVFNNNLLQYFVLTKSNINYFIDNSIIFIDEINNSIDKLLYNHFLSWKINSTFVLNGTFDDYLKETFITMNMQSLSNFYPGIQDFVFLNCENLMQLLGDLDKGISSDMDLSLSSTLGFMNLMLMLG